MNTTQQIQNFVTEAKQQLRKTPPNEAIQLDMEKIEYDFEKDEFRHPDLRLSKGVSTNKILELAKIRKGFGKLLSDGGDVEQLKTQIHTAISGMNVTGVYDHEQNLVVDVFENRYNNPRYSIGEMIDYTGNFLKEALGEKSSFEVSNVRVKRDGVRFSVIDRGSSVDVLSGVNTSTLSDSAIEYLGIETQSDDWQFGVEFEIYPERVSISQAFERVICTNGMVQQKGVNSMKLTTKDFSMAKLNRLINKSLSGVGNYSSELLQNRAKTFVSVNASLREVFLFWNAIESLSNEGEYHALLERIFPKSKSSYQEAYENKGYEFKDNDFWLSTANSGVNAYELLNRVTEACYRDFEFEFPQKHRSLLRSKASKMFLEGSPDLSNIAPQIL